MLPFSMAVVETSLCPRERIGKNILIGFLRLPVFGPGAGRYEGLRCSAGLETDDWE